MSIQQTPFDEMRTFRWLITYFQSAAYCSSMFFHTQPDIHHLWMVVCRSSSRSHSLRLIEIDRYQRVADLRENNPSTLSVGKYLL